MKKRFKDLLAKIKVQKQLLLRILIQTTVQSSIFFYLNLWRPIDAIRVEPGFIFLQVVLAFIFDYVWQKLVHKSYQVRFFVLPLVMSINLFLRFYSPYMQVLIVFAGIVLRSLFSRPIEGHARHVFNPSGIVLWTVAVILLLFRLEHYVLAGEIGVFYMETPNFDLFLFFASLITLWIPNSYAIPFGALVCFIGVDFIAERVTGHRLMYALAQGSVFLGMSLLITDPRTSPKNYPARFFFGFAYALGVMFFYWVLSYFNRETYYDKILILPLLNFLVPYFDRFFEKWDLTRLAGLRGLEFSMNQKRFLSLGIYALVFLLLYSRFESSINHPFALDLLAHKQIPHRLRE